MNSDCKHSIKFEHYCHLCEEEIEEYFDKRKLHMEFCVANELVYEATFEDYQHADFKQRKEIARWKHVTGFEDPESLKMYLSGQTIYQADDEQARIFSRVSSENAELKKKFADRSSDGSLEDFKDQLRFLWKEYVMADPRSLTDDAKVLRQELIDCVLGAK